MITRGPITTPKPARILLLVLLSLPVFGLAHADQAMAYEPPCWDYQCNTLTPSGTGCGSLSPVNLDNVASNTYAYTVDLYYSNTCGANWGLGRNEGCNSSGNCISAYYFQSNNYGSTAGWRSDHTAFLTYPSYVLSGYTSSDRVCLYEDHNTCTPWH